MRALKWTLKVSKIQGLNLGTEIPKKVCILLIEAGVNLYFIVIHLGGQRIPNQLSHEPTFGKMLHRIKTHDPLRILSCQYIKSKECRYMACVFFFCDITRGNFHKNLAT